jgi:hypothetical protein
MWCRKRESRSVIRFVTAFVRITPLQAVGEFGDLARHSGYRKHLLHVR